MITSAGAQLPKSPINNYGITPNRTSALFSIANTSMTIVSLSFPDQMIKELDQIRDSGGFAGRSELVRTAVRLMMEDRKEKDSLAGRVSAVIVVTHQEADEAPITRLKHQFEDIVRTHIHNKISHGNCVELFLVEGDGKKVSAITKEFQKEEKMRSVKLIVI